MTQRDYAKKIYQLEHLALSEDLLFDKLVEVNKEIVDDTELSLESKCELIRLIGNVFNQVS